jgi:hypothetical protein
MGPRQLIEARVEAFNTRDLKRIAEFYREDATNHQLPEAPVTGRDAIRATRQALVCSARVARAPNAARIASRRFSSGRAVDEASWRSGLTTRHRSRGYSRRGERPYALAPQTLR